MLSVATSFAFEVGEYAYNSTQRFKIDGENLVTNGNFVNGLEGWFGADKEDGPNSEVWSLVEGAGPNGETVIESLAPTEGMPLCNAWTLEPGTYVVSYQIKSETAGYTTLIYGGRTPDANAADFFLNTDGSFAKANSGVVNVASNSIFPAGEWKTQVYYATVEDGQQLVMHFEKLAAGIQITNVEIHAAHQTYDIRKAQNKIAFAKEVMENPAFNVWEARDAKDNLQNLIETVEYMIAGGEMDDESVALATMESFEAGGLEPYLAVTSVDVKCLIPGLDIAAQDYYGRAHIGNRAEKYKLDLQGNWGHLNTEPDALRSAIQLTFAHSATYTAYHEEFPAGRYFFTCEIRNANTDKQSWPTNPIFNLKTDSCLMFIGTDTIKTAAIEGEEYQRFSMIADVTEDGQFRAGIYWPGVNSGGAFFIRNTVVRAFNKNLVTDVEHIRAFKTYLTQWDGATSARSNARSLMGNANYPWGQNELKAEVNRLDPIYTAQANKHWSTDDGKDTGIATTEELLDWANFQGIEEYTEPDSLGYYTRKTYQLVRGYLSASNTIKATNQVFTDLGNAIEDAKKTRNTGAYLTGDRETYKSAILRSLSILKTVRSTTTDATRVADSTIIANALLTLNEATQAFLASVTNAPIVDIDFSKPFTEVNAEESIEVTRGNYYIEGAAGKMYFNTYDEDNTSSNGIALGYGEELLDVLRLGNGAGTVYLSKELTDNNELTVKFDLWVGNLSGRNVYVDLRNANDERVAGFSLNRYNGTVAYNEFNDVLTRGGTGLDLLTYVKGKGKGGVSDAAICANDNKSSFTLVVDYKGNTVKGSVVSNGTCEGAALPIPEVGSGDNKIAKIVIGSNYNNGGRRSWFDNLTVAVSSSAADIVEDITESPWAEVTEQPEFANGDVNHDKAVDVTDAVLIIDEILMKSPANFDAALADVNHDTFIDVTDVVLVIDKILGKIELSRGATQAEKDLSAYTAFQMDLTIPAGYVLEGVDLTEMAKGSHKLAYSKLADGRCRVVVFSMDNEALPGAWDEVIRLNLRGQGDATVNVDRAMFVTVGGERHELLINGTTSIAQFSTLNSQFSIVYDLTGRKVEKTAKGVYIENGRKVVVK